MEIRHLRYFVTVAEEENITRAAVRLNVTQTSLSRQVRDLENEFQFGLFERNAKSIRLTKPVAFFSRKRLPSCVVLLKLSKPRGLQPMDTAVSSMLDMQTR